MTGWKSVLMKNIARTFCLCSHQVLCTSNSAREIVVAQKVCPPEKINFLPNGVDTDLFCKATDEEIHTDRAAVGVRGKTVYIFVGNLHDQKGVDTLLRAWSRFERETAMDRERK